MDWGSLGIFYLEIQTLWSLVSRWFLILPHSVDSETVIGQIESVSIMCCCHLHGLEKS